MESMLLCVAVVLIVGVTLTILMVSRSGKGENPASLYRRTSRPGVLVTGRNDLTSWALHKQPGDITLSDYINYPAAGRADTVIHHEGGTYKVVKGVDAGLILSDWEVDDYIDSL